MPSVKQQPQVPLSFQADLPSQPQRPQLIAAQHPPQFAHRQVQYNPVVPDVQAVSSQFTIEHPQAQLDGSHSSVLHSSNQPLVSQQRSDGRSSQGEGDRQDLPRANDAPTDVVNGRDQYEMLRHQPSLIPRQSQSILAVPDQIQMPFLQHQSCDQSQFVESVTHKAAFATVVISYQTPQALSQFESASQSNSLAVQQASGHIVMQSRSQHRQHSMHHQLPSDDDFQPSAMSSAPARQDEALRGGQQQPYDGQWPSSRAAEAQPYSRQGQDVSPGQQQPCSVTAMRQHHTAEHTVSRSADGHSSHTVSSSSSHSEFSFRRSGGNPEIPKGEPAS